MCFTVNVNIVREELEKRYDADLIDHDNYRPSYYYHAYSTPSLPVICSDDRKKIELLLWGLIPSWAGDVKEAEEIRLKTFNARSESIDTKPSFREPFRSKRCIVPVRGFFEWQQIGGRKIPWYISLADEDIFSLAGIWDEWQQPDGDILRTFSIVTTRANELMSEIHNTKKRMPVILPQSVEHLWLKNDLSKESALPLMEPVDSGMLRAHTISPLITNNKADRNRAELIMPYNYPVQGKLF